MFMHYKDKEHQERFLNLIRKHDKAFSNGKVDSEYATAYFLLTANYYVWNKVSKYIDDDGINFMAMSEDCVFSSGELLLVKLAGNLFNGSFYKDISPLDFISTLDTEYFRVIMEAFKTRKMGGNLNKNYIGLEG